MSSAETSKKENTEEKTPMPLKVTIENPNTGKTMVIQPRFFVGLYTCKDETVPEGAIGVGQILEGASNTLEQITLVKAMQEKTVPMILDNIESHMEKEEKEAAGEYTKHLRTLLSTLLLGSLFSDD